MSSSQVELKLRGQVPRMELLFRCTDGAWRGWEEPEHWQECSGVQGILMISSITIRH